ncbi:hypothetical protein P3L10_031071 [Capsicum annuum]
MSSVCARAPGGLHFMLLLMLQQTEQLFEQIKSPARLVRCIPIDSISIASESTSDATDSTSDATDSTSIATDG